MKNLLALLLCCCMGSALAESYLMAEKETDHRVALDELSAAIMDHGYSVVKIQPVDKGLRGKGYHVTEDYKLIFFSSKDLERKALAISPDMANLLPLKIIVYQQDGRVVAAAPMNDAWRQAFHQAGAAELIRGVDADVRDILAQYGGEVHAK